MAASIGFPERPIMIAPAPGASASTHAPKPPPMMPYTCQACARRKVKCDKILPVCSTCRKGKSECIYQAPAPRKRKRRLSGDDKEKIARYEEILEQHGLLSQVSRASSPKDCGTGETAASTPFQEASRPGRLIAGKDRSRYIDNSFWRNLGEDAVDQMSDEEEDGNHQSPALSGAQITSDPFTGAFIGASWNLLDLHPTHEDALKLWKIHIQNAEPICKILHLPTASKMVESVSKQPALASKTDECLLFVVYHFAIASMDDAECFAMFGETKDILRSRYHFAARQALVNASLLKTTEMQVLQAYTLFLLSTKTQYDPQTLWMLTGIAMRSAQRMGLHRDGEALGLNPFDVQMRRRLFFQILPLEGFASMTAGTGLSPAFHAWDTKQPLNINDDQIWPGMTEPPKEQTGATEMMFILSRGTIGKFHVKTMQNLESPTDFKAVGDIDKKVDEAEADVEAKYLRYCDVVNPLHVLSMAIARSGANVIRLRARLQMKNQATMTAPEQKELCTLSDKMVDMDATMHSNPGLKRYMWHIGAWLVHQPLICILKCIANRDLLSPLELEAEWARLGQVYNNHPELKQCKRALHIAIGRLTFKAWEANPPVAASVAEPDFITILRYNRRTNANYRGEPRQTPHTTSDDSPLSFNTPLNDSSALFSGFNGFGDLGNDFRLEDADWKFWDQLTTDFQDLDEQYALTSGR